VPVLTKSYLRNYRGDLLALTALVAILIWFCDGMIFQDKAPFFRDLGTYTFPLKYSLAKSVKAGELPLWDRHIAAGFPLLAAFQPGVFYPPSLIFYALPFFAALRFTFFLHYLIAASGAYFLSRRWNYPVYLSMIVAILFTFGGTTVSFSNLLNHFQTAVWLPWMIFFWEQALQYRSWRNFIVLSLVLLCALLGGSPEIYLLSIGLLFIDGVRLKYQDRSITITAVVGWIAASHILVMALGMAQFLPTFELLSHSRRDQPIPFQEATAWSLQPTSLVGLFFPDKEVDASLPIGVRPFFTREIPFLLSHYLGVISFFAIGAWCYLTSRKDIFVAVALILGSLILALGHNTPIYGFLFDRLPPLQAIRFPEKFFFLSYVGLLFVVGRGLYGFHQASAAQRRIPLLVSFGILVLWLTIYGVLRFYPEWLQRIASRSGDPSDIASMAVTEAAILFHIERQIAITVAILLLLICHARNLLGSIIFQVGMVAIAVFDLGLVHKPFQFLLDPGLVAKSNMLPPPASADGQRLFYYPPGGNLHPSFVSVLGRPQFSKATALNTENLLPNTGLIYGYDYFQEIDALTRQPYNDFLDFANLMTPDRRVKLLRALNVRYVISFRELKAAGLTLLRRIPEQYSWLYEVKDPVPRVYVVAAGLQETQPAKILRLLSEPQFDPRNQVIVDQPVVGTKEPHLNGIAQITKYGNSRVVIEASLNGAGILVLADSYYPGWRVFVDGREGKILRANHFFRGVELAPGEHHVEFDYEPWSFALGLRITLWTLGLLILISLALLIKGLRMHWHDMSLRRRSRLIKTSPSLDHATTDRL